MTDQERFELRILQDRFLDHPECARFVEQFGVDHPLWKDGPSAKEMRAMLHPQWASEMERYLQPPPSC